MLAYRIELEHTLGVTGAIQAMERACEHYHKRFPGQVIFWKKTKCDTVDVGLRVAGIDGALRGDASSTSVILTLEVPDNINFPESFIKVFVRREAKKWLTTLSD